MTAERRPRVSGRLVDRDGKPVAGIPVMAHASKPGTSSKIGADFSEAESEKDGSFSLRLGRRGPWRLAFQASGYRAVARELSASDTKKDEIDLGAIEISRGTAVRGRVVEAVSGKPVGGARVIGEEVSDSQVSQKPDHADSYTKGSSEADGTFELFGFPEGSTVQLTVAHPDFAEAQVRFAAGTDSAEVRLGAGGTIEGTVCGPTGELAGATVSVTGPSSRREPVSVNASGRFRIEKVTPGRWLVIAQPARSFRWAGLTLGRETVTVEEGAASEVRVGCGSIVVSGTVLVDGKPATEVACQIIRARGNASAFQTDANGRFTTTVSTPGLYRITAHDGFTRTACDVPEKGATCTFDLMPYPR